jgi:serpin B
MRIGRAEIEVAGRAPSAPCRSQTLRTVARSMAFMTIASLTMAAAPAAARDATFDLLRAMSARADGRNVVMSPVSVGGALLLLSEGASGATREQILRAVGPGTPEALERLRAAARAKGGAGPGTVVEFGSVLWSPPSLAFAEGFRSIAEGAFSAGVISSEPQAAPAALNAWMAKATRGLIPKAIDAPPDARGIVLANGMVFLGKWREPFDPALTQPRAFTAADGKRTTAPMMARTATFRHAALPEGQVIDLPYDDGRYSFRIFLPETTAGLEAFLAKADSVSWQAMGRDLREATGELVLPRLDVAFAMELGPALGAMGVTAAFSPGAADFSPMTEQKAPLYVASVLHRTVVKVDEAGTKAAASTVIQMPGSAVPRVTFRMVIDKPFVFAIHEASQNDLLFIGVVRSLDGV